MADENTNGGVEAPVVDQTQNVAPSLQPNAAPAAPEGQAPAIDKEAIAAVVAEVLGKNEEANKVDQVAGEADGDTFSYTATGDAGLDVALEFIGKLGFGGTDPVVVAAANGDFTQLEAKLAALGPKAAGWERMIQLGKDAFSRAKEAGDKADRAKTSAIISVVGSQENWQAISAWTAKNASPEEKKEFNQLIELGPVGARAAATLLLATYQKANGTTVHPAAVTRNGASGEQAQDRSGPLTGKEYSAAVRDLRTKLGPDFERSQEYRTLQARLR